MTTRPRVVVTGFEPFGAWSDNPTLAVVDRLRRRTDLPFDLSTLELPVDSTRVGTLATDALASIKPDLWISLGLAAGLAVVAVERIAANVLDFAIPDNAGVCHRGEAVVATGPAAYFSTLPVRAITDRLRACGIPARLSNSASTFLCNQMMYAVLHGIATRGLSTRAGFLHVPAHPALAARQPAPVDMPSMDIELMTAAVIVTIRTALEALPADPLQR